MSSPTFGSSNASSLNAMGSARSTLIGFAAVLMWSASVGLMRSVSELLGPIGGAACIFSASAIFACAAFGLRWREIPRTYLFVGGFLFVAYEICLALAIGLAANRTQSLELGMINYLWPSLTIVLAVLVREQRASAWLAPALLLCLAGIFWVMKGDGEWSAEAFWFNVRSNGVAYALALIAAFLWPMYSLVARRYGNGANAVPLFLVITAGLLWLKYAMSAESALTLSWPAVLQVLAMGLLTAAAYSCWNFGVQRGNLTVLAAMSYFTPVLSMALASLWLSVAPGSGFFYGVAMVTAGSLLSWWSTR